jgi:hypothetical protein
MVRFSRQAILLALAALAIPACGGDGGGGGGGSSQTLFKEDFSGAFPGTAWTAPFSTAAGTSVQIDNSGGDATLRMTTTADPAFVGTTTTMEFNSRPMTVSVQISATGSGEGSGGIAILDHLGASVAAAEWHAATPSALTFRILSTTNPSPIAVPLADSGFHRFTFSVDDAGEATWKIDGTTVMTVSGFPDDLVRVQLYDNISSTSASSFALFRFDNVEVTAP